MLGDVNSVRVLAPAPQDFIKDERRVHEVYQSGRYYTALWQVYISSGRQETKSRGF